MEAVTCHWLHTHPHHPSLPPTHPFIHTTYDITVAVKKVVQNPAVLGNRDSYKTLAKYVTALVIL